MIRLQIEEYCDWCLDFSPDVTPPSKILVDDKEPVLTDTIVKCEYSKRCANIKRYLERQMKEEAVG